MKEYTWAGGGCSASTTLFRDPFHVCILEAEITTVFVLSNSLTHVCTTTIENYIGTKHEYDSKLFVTIRLEYLMEIDSCNAQGVGLDGLVGPFQLYYSMIL